MFEFVATTSNVSLPYSCLKTQIESCLVHSTEPYTTVHNSIGDSRKYHNKPAQSNLQNVWKSPCEHYIVHVTFPPRLIRSFRYALPTDTSNSCCVRKSQIFLSQFQDGTKTLRPRERKHIWSLRGSSVAHTFQRPKATLYHLSCLQKVQKSSVGGACIRLFI